MRKMYLGIFYLVLIVSTLGAWLWSSAVHSQQSQILGIVLNKWQEDVRADDLQTLKTAYCLKVEFKSAIGGLFTEDVKVTEQKYTSIEVGDLWTRGDVS